MADPHTLKVGDTVTHPEWPEGTTRQIIGLSGFTRMTRVNGRAKPVTDPNQVVCHLDGKVLVEGEHPSMADDAWMEAGLVRK
jgi:hypothetical protein